jgi:hypothetical protein
MSAEAKTATDANGRKIRVGDKVEAMDIYSGEWSGRIVEVARIHRQGYDGTIVTTSPAPIAEYPHHFSHQASKTRKVD